MDTHLNICLLNDSFPPVIDGVANVVSNYATVLTQKGHRVLVATPQYPGTEDHYPYEVLRYPSFNTTGLVGYRTGNPFTPAAVHQLERRPIELLHSHCPVASTLLGRTIRESNRIPLIFTYHTKFDIDIARAIASGVLQQAAIRLLIKNIEACDEVWVVSHGAGENLRSLGYTGEYIVMENGVDFPRGPADGPAVARLAESHQLPPGMPVFLFVGRIMWYKGLRLILEGLKQLQYAGERFRMIFVGDGADRPEVEALAGSLGLADRCIFTGSIQDRALLRTYFSLADLFLFPSTFDTNGIVVREAAACGLPSLLIRGSCAAEGIQDGRHGILIEEDAAALATAALGVCRDRDAAARMGRTAMDELYLSWEDAVGRATRRYQKVVADYRAGLYPLKKARGDELLGMAAELLNALELARSGEVGRKIKKLFTNDERYL